MSTTVQARDDHRTRRRCFENGGAFKEDVIKQLGGDITGANCESGSGEGKLELRYAK